jgi:hypothetical protein
MNFVLIFVLEYCGNIYYCIRHVSKFAKAVAQLLHVCLSVRMEHLVSH